MGLLISSTYHDPVFTSRRSDGKVIVLEQSGQRVFISDSATPTSFSEAGTTIPGITDYAGFCMSSGERVNVAYKWVDGMTNRISNRYMDTITSNNSTTLENITTLDVAPNTFKTRICADSNGKLHVVWFDTTTVMGTNWTTVYYSNNVGGTWKARVEVLGASASLGMSDDLAICLNASGVPYVFCFDDGGTNQDMFVMNGNLNDATSFSQTGTINVNSNTTPGKATQSDIFIVSSVVYVVWASSTTSYNIWKVGTSNYGITKNNTSSGAYQLSSVLVGTNLHLFYLWDNAGVPNVNHIVVSISGSPTKTSEDSTDIEYITDSVVKTNNGEYFNYSSNGTDTGWTTNKLEIDLVWQRILNTASAWTSYSLAAVTNVSKIKVSTWKDFSANPQINIGGVWKTATAVKINIGGVWKDVDITP